MDPQDLIISEEVEPIDEALPGVNAHFSKVGPSVMPSYVAGQELGSIEFASMRFGHATQGVADFADDVAALVVATPGGPGERWDGHDIEPGHVVLYGPGARHTSSGPPGIHAGLLVAQRGALREASEVLGRVLETPPLYVLGTDQANPWIELVAELRATPTTPDPDAAETRILDMLVRTLSRSPRRDRRRPRGDQADHRIVSRVLDYLDAAGRWAAPMLRLCEITGMSDRRVQAAFLAVFDTPPSTYLRNRALSAARTRLVAANADTLTVTQVAVDHDFYHLGRFSRYYRDVYGESPSTTLGTPPR